MIASIIPNIPDTRNIREEIDRAETEVELVRAAEKVLSAITPVYSPTDLFIGKQLRSPTLFKTTDPDAISKTIDQWHREEGKEGFNSQSNGRCYCL